MDRLSRSHVGVGLAACVLIMTAGCSTGPAGWVTDASRAVRPSTLAPSSPEAAPGGLGSTTTLPSAPSSAPPFAVTTPLDTGTYSEAPCTTIPSAGLIAWSLEPGQQTNPGGGHPTCRWQVKTDPLGAVVLTFVDTSLREQYGYAASHPGSAARVVTIAGYPAVSTTTNPNGRHGCDVAVAVGPDGVTQQGFRLTVFASTGDACGSAESFAEKIIANSLAPGH
jgi:hypothetical protein